MNIYNYRKTIAKVLCGFTLLTTSATITSCSKKNDNSSNSIVEDNQDIIMKDKIDYLSNGLSNDIQNKFFLNSDDVESVLTILNIDYICKNASYDLDGEVVSSALDLIYPNGLNTKKELNDINTFLSKYREYTESLKNVDEFLRISNYSLLEQDKIILSELENKTINLINLINSNGSKEEIEKLYNEVHSFYVNEGLLIINEKEYKKEDLSNGASKCSEVFGNIFSSITRNHISYEKREELSNKLRTTNSLYQIQVLLEVFGNNKSNVVNMMVNNEDTYILDESDVEMINLFTNKTNDVLNNLKNKVNVTNEEVASIVQIANLDYLVSDNVSAGAMKSIITSDFETLIRNGKSFIEKVEKYNKENQTNLYIYDDLFVLDEENDINITAIKGHIKSVLSLYNSINENSLNLDIYNNINYKFIELYNLYSSEANVNGITKNDTGYGTRFITNNISRIALESLGKDLEILKAVNEENSDLAIYPIMNSMIDGKCSKYQYVK